jgi:hypothetical protein
MALVCDTPVNIIQHGKNEFSNQIHSLEQFIVNYKQPLSTDHQHLLDSFKGHGYDTQSMVDDAKQDITIISNDGSLFIKYVVVCNVVQMVYINTPKLKYTQLLYDSPVIRFKYEHESFEFDGTNLDYQYKDLCIKITSELTSVKGCYNTWNNNKHRIALAKVDRLIGSSHLETFECEQSDHVIKQRYYNDNSSVTKLYVDGDIIAYHIHTPILDRIQLYSRREVIFIAAVSGDVLIDYFNNVDNDICHQLTIPRFDKYPFLVKPFARQLKTDAKLFYQYYSPTDYLNLQPQGTYLIRVSIDRHGEIIEYDCSASEIVVNSDGNMDYKLTADETYMNYFEICGPMMFTHRTHGDYSISKMFYNGEQFGEEIYDVGLFEIRLFIPDIGNYDWVLTYDSTERESLEHIDDYRFAVFADVHDKCSIHYNRHPLVVAEKFDYIASHKGDRTIGGYKMTTTSTQNSMISVILSKVDDKKTTSLIVYRLRDGFYSESENINEKNYLTITAYPANVGGFRRMGYKACLTDQNKMCLVTLRIPEEAECAMDQYCYKYRASEAIVVGIERVFYLQGKYYLASQMKLSTDRCCICFDNYANSQIIPCKHSFCGTCLIACAKTSFKCPYCRGDIGSTKENLLYSFLDDASVDDINVPVNKAYSFIADRSICYEVNTSIVVENFDTNLDKHCGNGIHYHRNVDDVFKWFEYIDIPNYVCLDMYPMTENITKLVRKPTIFDWVRSLGKAITY